MRDLLKCNYSTHQSRDNFCSYNKTPKKNATLAPLRWQHFCLLNNKKNILKFPDCTIPSKFLLSLLPHLYPREKVRRRWQHTYLLQSKTILLKSADSRIPSNLLLVPLSHLSSRERAQNDLQSFSGAGKRSFPEKT